MTTTWDGTDTLLVKLRTSQVGALTTVHVLDNNGTISEAGSKVDAAGFASHSVSLLGLDLSHLEITALVHTNDSVSQVTTIFP
jgi:hypothetical protein